MPSHSSKMATKNCPKCDAANPVACKKCACGHVFFATRRNAYAMAAAIADVDDMCTEGGSSMEPEVPRRRTARVTRERPQFYDALQVENQSRRQRELQKRRKASKSEDADVVPEETPEKVVSVPTKRRAESPPAKVVEPPAKKRRGRPPGLTSRKSSRAQILSTKLSDANTKLNEPASTEEGLQDAENIHDIPPIKALQMNMILSDINNRICSTGVRPDTIQPMDVETKESPSKTEVKSADEEKMEIKAELSEVQKDVKSDCVKKEMDELTSLNELKKETVKKDGDELASPKDLEKDAVKKNGDELTPPKDLEKEATKKDGIELTSPKVLEKKTFKEELGDVDEEPVKEGVDEVPSPKVLEKETLKKEEVGDLDEETVKEGGDEGASPRDLEKEAVKKDEVELASPKDLEKETSKKVQDGFESQNDLEKEAEKEDIAKKLSPNKLEKEAEKEDIAKKLSPNKLEKEAEKEDIAKKLSPKKLEKEAEKKDSAEVGSAVVLETEAVLMDMGELPPKDTETGAAKIESKAEAHDMCTDELKTTAKSVVKSEDVAGD